MLSSIYSPIIPTLHTPALLGALFISMSSLELGPAGKLSCEKLPVHGLRSYYSANMMCKSHETILLMYVYVASYVLSFLNIVKASLTDS